MQIYKKLLTLSFIFIAFLTFFSNAKAATLSQTSVSLSIGQTSTVYASNTSNTLYLSSNSTPSVASISIIGNNINIYGIASGNTTGIICESNTSICTPIYITVNNNNGYSSTLSLSQTSISLSVGQTTTVTAYNNSYNNYGTLYVSSNSNSNVATSSVSGNVISIYGTNTGSSNITICQNYNSTSCGTVYVTVSGYGNGYPLTNNGGLNISNMTLAVGGSITLSSSNSTGLYVSNNSNPSVVSALSGSASVGCTANALYSVVTGQPCFNSGVSNYYNNYNTSYISGCYGNNQYSTTTGQPCFNGNSINNNGGSITISALAVGSDTITLCQSSGTCNTIYVTVNNYYSVPINNPYNYYNQ